jgi:hypothetical protein
MLYREIIAVCSQNHTKHINTLCGQNVELVNIKLAVHIVTTGLEEDDSACTVPYPLRLSVLFRSCVEPAKLFPVCTHSTVCISYTLCPANIAVQCHVFLTQTKWSMSRQ